MSILNDGSIAETIGAVCGDLFGEPVTVHVRASAVDDDGVPAATFVDVAAIGTRLAYSDRRRFQAGIPATDAMVLLYQTTTEAEPRPQDQVTISGQRYECVTVTPDPAAATWEIQARPV